jgi:hypothetical protein
VEWFQLTEDEAQCHSHVNKVMNLPVLQKQINVFDQLRKYQLIKKDFVLLVNMNDVIIT